MRIKQFILIPFLLITILSACAETRVTSDQGTTALMKIQVSGIGRVFEMPDMAYLNLTFSDRGTDAESVRNKIDKQVAALLKLSRKLGIEESDIQAAQLSINPEYDYKRERALIGYRVTRNVRIKLKDLTIYSNLLDAALSLGVTNTSNLQLDFSNRSALENKAMVEALKIARSKAEILALEAGGSLGKAVWIGESASYSPAPTGVRMMAAEAADASYPTGDLEIQKSLQVHFELVYD